VSAAVAAAAATATASEATTAGAAGGGVESRAFLLARALRERTASGLLLSTRFPGVDDAGDDEEEEGSETACADAAPRTSGEEGTRGWEAEEASGGEANEESACICTDALEA